MIPSGVIALFVVLTILTLTYLCVTLLTTFDPHSDPVGANNQIKGGILFSSIWLAIAVTEFTILTILLGISPSTPAH